MPRKKTPLVHGLGVSFVCGVVGLGGCSATQPPTAVVSQAQLAVREAGQSQAAQYASRELSSAQEKYDRAKRALDAERYTEARRLAEQALVDAELAETKAEAVGALLFAYNQAELKPGAMQNLYQLVTFLRENPERQVLIEGHTDNHGSEDYNHDLSRRRAETVRSFPLQNGIPPERLTARGYGEAYPVAPNGTEAGRQQNRRVEVVILKAGEHAAQRMR